MHLRRVMVVVLACVWAVPTAAQEEASDTLLTVQHFLNFEGVADPQISPDGSQIIYTRRWVDKVEDRWQSALWIMNADGSRNRFLVEGSNARWSPDGSRILYIAPGDPKGAQIHVRWMDAEGATSQVTRLTESPGSPSWSPDGESIAFIMFVENKPSWSIPMPRPPEGASWTPGPGIVDRLHYRQDRVGYTEPGFTHLFVVPADGGTPRELTEGKWNVGARFDGLGFGATYDWTPDGAHIVFDGWRYSEGDDIYRRSEIYAVHVESGDVRQITQDRPGFWSSPAVSPDGRRVAFTGYDSTDVTYNMGRLHVINLDGTGWQTLTSGLDREPGSLVWDRDTRGVYFTAGSEGSSNVHFASLSGEVASVTAGTHMLSLTSATRGGDQTAVGVRSDFDEPGDVVRYALRRDDGITTLTSVNDDILDRIRLGEVEEVWYESSGGARIQGWIVKPPSFDPSQRYPLVLEIHGGPFAMYNVGFNYMFQNFAANGYVVLYTNPRGSTGYGEEFSRAINFRYPGVDYEDLMAGVDEVIGRGYVDTTRMYVGGCSGGGVLSSWVIGHTDRFAAAAVRCPVTNWLSFIGQTDVPFFTHSFFRTAFWEDPTRWLEQSSLMYVGNVETPTLLMTGELDLRTPMPQTEEYFAALKLRGVETRLLRFKEEYHGTGSKPSNFMRTLLYMQSWYEQYGAEVNGGR